MHTQCAAAATVATTLLWQQLRFGNNFTGGGCRLPSFRWPVGLRHLLVGLQNLRAGGLFSLTPDAARLPYGLMHLHLGDRCKWSLQQIGLLAELQHLEMGYFVCSADLQHPLAAASANLDLWHDIQSALAGRSSAGNALRAPLRQSFRSGTGWHSLAIAGAAFAFWF